MIINYNNERMSLFDVIHTAYGIDISDYKRPRVFLQHLTPVDILPTSLAPAPQNIHSPNQELKKKGRKRYRGNFRYWWELQVLVQ